MSLINRQGDFDNDGNGQVNADDTTFLTFWLAASGGGGPGVYGTNFLYNRNGIIYKISEEAKTRNFSNSNEITPDDLTYLKFWLAASGGGGEGTYDTDFVYNRNGIVYRVNTLASVSWSGLNKEIPNSNKNVFFEIYNIPYNIDVAGSTMTDVSSNDGIIITLDSASGTNISEKSNVHSDYLQLYNDVHDKPLNSNVNSPLNNIKLKNDSLYQLPISVPLVNTLEVIKKLALYKFKDGDGDAGIIIVLDLEATNLEIKDKDSVILDHATYKLYIMRNNFIVKQLDLPKFPETGFGYPQAMLFT